VENLAAEIGVINHSLCAVQRACIRIQRRVKRPPLASFDILLCKARYYGCGWDTWKQATSYWLTDLGFFEFCGCSPAYTVPATPFGLNAEPGALAALPGRDDESSHDWLGCPPVPGLAAKAGTASARHNANTTTTKPNRFVLCDMDIPPYGLNLYYIDCHPPAYQ
jgi:hypothetical protein